MRPDPWEKLGTLRFLASQYRCAQFTYEKFREGASIRVIEPYAVSVTDKGYFIIAGWQIHPFVAGRDPWRNYRLDRMTDIEDAGISFDPRAEINLSEDDVPIFIFSSDNGPRETFSQGSGECL